MTETSNPGPASTPAQPEPAAPQIAMPDFPPNYVAKDYVDGPSSGALLNTTFDYEYTIGNTYRLIFNGDFGVSFQMLNDGSEVRGPLPYRCREMRPNQYLVHWMVKQFSIHVALVIDLELSTITVAAVMPPGQWEFFDIAKDIRVTRTA
jgi:hypothetical protein